MKLNVQFFWLVLVLSSAMVCGCAPVRTTTYDAMVRSCNIFHRQGWDDGMNRQWFLTQSCRHKPSSSAASITQTTEESAKHVSIDALWSRLEVVAEMVRERSSTGGVFTRKQIDQQDPTILNLLEANAGVSSEIPTTVLGLTKTYLTKGGGGFIVFSMLVAFLFRMSLIPVSPLGVGDILCIIGTRIFWQAQEWLIHSRWFHGGDNLRALSLFKSHDRHHDLPYYHVSVEPLRLAVVWWACIFVPLTLSVKFLRVPASMASTVFLTYKFSAFLYSFLHMMCHSKIVFKGRMNVVRTRHIKHHISPAHHLNIGPDNFDKLMNTNSYDARLNKKLQQ